ncbi:MAG TPA: universal stress protein [Nitrospirales bacterium]|nr:universal stress protein [Nitrospirales bacterium]
MKILCAVDDSDYSRLAIQSVGSVFRSAVKEIVLLHVVDSHLVYGGRKAAGAEAKSLLGLSKKIQQAGKKLLHEFAERLTVALGPAGSMPVMKPVLVKGHVSDTIIEWSEKIGTDCVALGSRGIHDIPGYVLGSVSRKVMIHAPCSVFMVKGPIGTQPFPVLIALDGSKSSKFTARTLQAWLDPEAVSLRLVSVVPDRFTDLASEVLGKRQVRNLLRPIQRGTRELLKDYREKFLKTGHEVKTELLEGAPPDQILQAAERHHVGLICLGSKGLSGIERFTLGSVSEWVSTYASQSVLVLRH